MNIFIVRHAETELNNQGIIQGSDIDTEINKNGMLQSNKFFYKYKKYPFQKIYISKLRRTYQSIIKFIELGIPYEKLEGLNEMKSKYPRLTELWLCYLQKHTLLYKKSLKAFSLKAFLF